jgi:hypothetical protein
MPNPKPKPTESLEVSGPRKRKLSTKVATNSDPAAERKKQKLVSKKQGTKPAPTKKRNTTKPVAKPAQQQRQPSIEEIEDESDHNTSVPPRNPLNILEAADGSDDDVVISLAPRNPQNIPEAADGSEDDNEEGSAPGGNKNSDLEAPERSDDEPESDEAELST